MKCWPGWNRSCEMKNLDIACKYLSLIAISGVAVIVDQLTKGMVLQKMSLHESISLIPGLLNLVHVHNPGGAFGFFGRRAGNGFGLLFILISGLAVGVILYLYHRTPRQYPVLSAGLALIFGGAVGNMIDRLRFGWVVDFIDLHAGDLHWPAFNVADSAITIGMAIFIYYIVFHKSAL